ncbi:MAG: hypothetical protein KF795_17390 [Labilithrix sp.]|nr:hypothetical protein [Labilithrix sp.]
MKNALPTALATALFLACSGGSGAIDAADPAPTPDAPPPGDPGPYVALGLNDVTILAPVPKDAAGALLGASDSADDGAAIVPRDVFERVALPPVPESGTMPVVPAETYDRLQVVAVRFDLCDRNLPGACAAADDGRVRLVFQPFSAGGFDDIGFHAFYSVPAAEIADMVKDVRELAELQRAPRTSPLEVSPALSAGKADYRDKLRAMLRRRAGGTKLVRLTMNAQPLVFSQVRWVMRGVEKKDGAFVDTVIPGVAGSTQEVITSGPTGFESKPVVEAPAGLSEVIDDTTFAAATDARKRELLDVLADADNPNETAPDTVSCIACHTSTSLMDVRAKSLGVDPKTIPRVYTSSYDLSVGGLLRERRVIRALGYFGDAPMISQRVVNDSAQVLDELDARFPPR